MDRQQLWAPWRLGYILDAKKAADLSPGSGELAAATELSKTAEALQLLPGGDPACFLCRAAVDADHDRENFVVTRGPQSLVVLNRYPYNNGHLLVAPRQHLADLDQLPDELNAELARTLAQMTGLLRRAMGPDGFNIGLNLGRVAGAGLPGHLHWHIVPRWSGDTNFMPVLADVHVIPQALEALFEILRSELAVR